MTILNIVHAEDGSIIPPRKLYGFKISALIFNQIITVKFTKKDLGCVRRFPMGILRFPGGVHFQLNAFGELHIRVLLADIMVNEG